MLDNIEAAYYISPDFRLDPNEKKLWLEALVSDEYKNRQGIRMLKTPNGNFCCLGVYCEVKGVPNTPIVVGEKLPNGEASFINTFVYGEPENEPRGWSHGVIPIGWAIPTTQAGHYFTGEETIFHADAQGNKAWKEIHEGTPYTKARPYNLTGLNDNGFTFAQIADIIRYFL